MKQKIKILLILTLIILIFKNYSLVLSSTILATSIFLHKVFPYLFIMITMQDLLINLNIISYFKNPITYIYLMSILSGTPSSSIIVSNLYKSRLIDKSYASNSLLFTSFPNPLFLYTILVSIFLENLIVFKLILIIYLSSFIMFLFYKKNLSNVSMTCLNNNSSNLSNSLKVSINTCIMVLGTIIFYLNLSNVLHVSSIPLLSGLLEMTQGLNLLIESTTVYKEYLAVFFLTFQGFSIHTQVSCILHESNLDYKYFLKGRVIHAFLAIFLLFIVNLFI